MTRSLVAFYGVIAYVIGMGGLACFILFLSGWSFVPVHIDSHEPGNVGFALAVNSGLMLLFGAHHSVCARPSFKAMLTKVIPVAAERSTYVLCSGVLMLVICIFWQALPGELWHPQGAVAIYLLTAGYLAGWVIALISTFLINHFELFGLQQVYFHLKNKPEPPMNFVESYFYRFVRHPLQFGVLMGIWFTPHMTSTHLFLAVTLTIYIVIGLYYEEKDLVRTLGENYSDYQGRVSKLIPMPVGKKTTPAGG